MIFWSSVRLRLGAARRGVTFAVRFAGVGRAAAFVARFGVFAARGFAAAGADFDLDFLTMCNSPEHFVPRRNGE